MATKVSKAAGTDQDAADKRKKRLERLANANKISFTLEPEVRKLAQIEAKKSGMDMGHFMQKLVETHVLSVTDADNPLVQRIQAKRDVIDQTVKIAREIDAKGGFDEHFILTVMQTAAKDSTYAKMYKTAVGGVANDSDVPEKRKAPLNQQLGRLIKQAVGAKSKRDEKGKIARAQVSGEAISTYTLLVKSA